MAFSQDPQASYGKTLRIDLRTLCHFDQTRWGTEPTGTGYPAPDGRIWEAEHGAQGGDEVNLLVPRRRTTAGQRLHTAPTTARSIGPLSKQQGHHAGFDSAARNLGSRHRHLDTPADPCGERFPIWRGDLLAGTLGCARAVPCCTGWRWRSRDRADSTG